MSNHTSTYTNQIPLRYLHEGTSFVAANTVTGERILARADMDGHGVSENYGARTGNHYYDAPEVDYINVKLRVIAVEAENAGAPEDEYGRAGRKNAFGYGYGPAERPIGYSVLSRYGVNTSLHVKDGWVALVTPGTYSIYEADLAQDAAADEETIRHAKIAEAEASLAAALAAVEKAQTDLASLRY